MSIHGWSLPPGCGRIQVEASGDALELTKHVPLTGDTRAVFWDEDGVILEAHDQKVLGDEAAGLPSFTDMDTRRVGEFPWSDHHDQEENIRRAAEHYRHLKGLPQ